MGQEIMDVVPVRFVVLLQDSKLGRRGEIREIDIEGEVPVTDLPALNKIVARLTHAKKPLMATPRRRLSPEGRAMIRQIVGHKRPNEHFLGA